MFTPPAVTNSSPGRRCVRVSGSPCSSLFSSFFRSSFGMSASRVSVSILHCLRIDSVRRWGRCSFRIDLMCFFPRVLIFVVSMVLHCSGVMDAFGCNNTLHGSVSETGSNVM